MDPVANPFAPGAGTPPPELAGRAKLLEAIGISLQRARSGYPTKSVLIVGLRGVGKTVLLDRIRDDAEKAGIHTIRIEAPETRSLPALVAPELRRALLRLSRTQRAREAAERALRALSGFARAMKLKYGDIEVGLDFDPEPGLADNGNLESDLLELLESAGTAAKDGGTALALFVDELQYVRDEQLGALVTSLHRTTQRELPVILVGAGLPQLRALVGKAKSYSERLFEIYDVGPLTQPDARLAISRPIQAAGEEMEIDPSALARITEVTECYPYFLQEWGKHAWDIAPESPITRADVDSATEEALAALDSGFFLVRFDRLTPLEKNYMRAMAELGPGPHRSGDIAECMGRPVQRAAPIRDRLIAKGMIWSPAHGDTAFTVPLFDGFMRRIMPTFEP